MNISKKCLKKLKIGAGSDNTTEVTPLISIEQLQRVSNYCQSGIQSGAKLIIGGEKHDQENGNYYKPTIFDNVDPKSTIAQEEIFNTVYIKKKTVKKGDILVRVKLISVYEPSTILTISVIIITGKKLLEPSLTKPLNKNSIIMLSSLLLHLQDAFWLSFLMVYNLLLIK